MMVSRLSYTITLFSLLVLNIHAMDVAPLNERDLQIKASLLKFLDPQNENIFVTLEDVLATLKSSNAPVNQQRLIGNIKTNYFEIKKYKNVSDRMIIFMGFDQKDSESEVEIELYAPVDEDLKLALFKIVNPGYTTSKDIIKAIMNEQGYYSEPSGFGGGLYKNQESLFYKLEKDRMRIDGRGIYRNNVTNNTDASALPSQGRTVLSAMSHTISNE